MPLYFIGLRNGQRVIKELEIDWRIVGGLVRVYEGWGPAPHSVEPRPLLSTLRVGSAVIQAAAGAVCHYYLDTKSGAKRGGRDCHT